MCAWEERNTHKILIFQSLRSLTRESADSRVFSPNSNVARKSQSVNAKKKKEPKRAEFNVNNRNSACVFDRVCVGVLVCIRQTLSDKVSIKSWLNLIDLFNVLHGFRSVHVRFHNWKESFVTNVPLSLYVSMCVRVTNRKRQPALRPWVTETVSTPYCRQDWISGWASERIRATKANKKDFLLFLPFVWGKSEDFIVHKDRWRQKKRERAEERRAWWRAVVCQKRN